MSIVYEKGTAAWDIGQILTRHFKGLAPGQVPCNRVAVLVKNTNPARDALGQPRLSAEQRLDEALRTACTCGIGDSTSETTSLTGGPNGGATEPLDRHAESAP